MRAHVHRTPTGVMARELAPAATRETHVQGAESTGVMGLAAFTTLTEPRVATFDGKPFSILAAGGSGAAH